MIELALYGENLMRIFLEGKIFLQEDMGHNSFKNSTNEGQLCVRVSANIDDTPSGKRERESEKKV